MSQPLPDRSSQDTAAGEDHDHHKVPTPRETPGGPYFGRLLIVLLLAVAFCAFMTWLLSSTLPD